MMNGNGQLSVPPGFRFHPTDEELLYYYLRKKVSYEAIDLDVIREVDINKLEPWDLKNKCRNIESGGPQNEWYFFSHRDKKYPTGTRTNRATTAGFWKATGRDKAIHQSNSKRIGMRKTLVFYTGRAPHGQKTDWIMHEYRLDDDNAEEDGWVVCRVFEKNNHSGASQPKDAPEQNLAHIKTSSSTDLLILEPKQSLQAVYGCTFDGHGSIYLPQLLTPPESAVHPSLNLTDMEFSQDLLRLASGSCGGLVQQERFSTGDWSFLDKLLASHQVQFQGKCNPWSVPRC
ncbi:unnamed protein product [Ilex paraguariensis]|uniref:NAC domain-containing protein n=1 Tax=Ilex paraguariensis TaxID=185542 RepID=A0ABC8T894_9AQUA